MLLNSPSSIAEIQTAQFLLSSFKGKVSETQLYQIADHFLIEVVRTMYLVIDLQSDDPDKVSPRSCNSGPGVVLRKSGTSSPIRRQIA